MTYWPFKTFQTKQTYHQAIKSQPQRTQKLAYEELNSILCEYKAGKIEPTYEDPVSLEICVELYEEEADDITSWTYEEKKARRPMTVSVLRLTYPRKTNEWFDKPFLSSPAGVMCR